MLLEGSCHCGAVKFSVESHTPQPFMRCYCSICRKTAGGGGYAINVMGDSATLKVEGEDDVSVYRVKQENGTESPLRRHFCRHCGTALWCFDPRWEQWVYPFASAIDTPLPVPPERVHLLLNSAAPWVQVPEGPGETCFDEYPEESIEDWHKCRGLWVE